MTVYKYFMKIVYKYKFVILAYGSIFLVFAGFVTLDIDSQDIMSFQEEKQIIGIVNNSDSDLSRGLVDYLGNQHILIDMEYDEDYIKEEIFLEQVNAVVIIPEDFHNLVINKEEAIEIFRDDRRMGPYQVQNQINKFIAFANATYSNGEFNMARVKEALDNSIEVEILEETNGIAQDANAWYKFYYNFAAYTILALYISIIGMVMSDFNVKEVEARRKVSSISLMKYNREIYLGQITIATIITIVFIIASIVLQGKNLQYVDFSKYLLNIGIYSFSALCMVFLIVNITTNKYAITAIGNALSLGLSFISGVFVPQEFLSENVLNISKFFPIYYYVRINEMNISSLLDMRFEIFMQLLFAFAFLLMGLYFARTKQKA